MSTRPRIFVAATLISAAGCLQAQPASRCHAVYEDAVRNVDLVTRQLSQNRSIFAQHCEESGSVKSTSEKLDLTIPVKQVTIGFEGSREQALSEMRRFCKTYAERFSSNEQYFQLNDRVVVDALASFNRCLALEQSGVYMEHVATASQALLVRVNFNPTAVILRVRNVQYDEKTAKCTADLGSNGNRIPVSAGMEPINATAPFSVACERTGTTRESGELVYPRLELTLDTSHGAYSVSLPSEGLNGYELASEIRIRDIAKSQEMARLASSEERHRSTATALIHAITQMTATSHIATQGQGANVACPQDGGRLDQFMRASCPDGRLMGINRIQTSSGRRCGYTTYTWSCITFPKGLDVPVSMLLPVKSGVQLENEFPGDFGEELASDDD